MCGVHSKGRNKAYNSTFHPVGRETLLEQAHTSAYIFIQMYPNIVGEVEDFQKYCDLYELFQRF